MIEKLKGQVVNIWSKHDIQPFIIALISVEDKHTHKLTKIKKLSTSKLASCTTIFLGNPSVNNPAA